MMEDDMMIGKLINKGFKVLKDLLPAESVSKEVDLATLTLIYPFEILNDEKAEELIAKVSGNLERNNGVIRYHGDAYYNNNPHGSIEDRKGEELEWCMGFAFLAHAHKQLGNDELAEEYFQELVRIHKLNGKNGIPEGYYAKTDKENDNSTLGWSTAMVIDYIIKYKKDELK